MSVTKVRKFLVKTYLVREFLLLSLKSGHCTHIVIEVPKVVVHVAIIHKGKQRIRLRKTSR